MSAPLEQLVAFLQKTATEIADLENRANDGITQHNDEALYRELMEQKARLLAGLLSAVAPLVKTLPAEHRSAVVARLDSFSANATTSLKIGSVFYMSALLYPDGHQKGQPNNLELFIQQLEKI